jgi:hypothetical protein
VTRAVAREVTRAVAREVTRVAPDIAGKRSFGKIET